MHNIEDGLAFAGRFLPAAFLGVLAGLFFSLGIREPGLNAFTWGAALCIAIGAGGRLARLRQWAADQEPPLRSCPTRILGVICFVSIVVVVGLPVAVALKLDSPLLPFLVRWPAAALVTGCMWLIAETIMCLVLFRRPYTIWKGYQGRRLKTLRKSL